MTKRLEILLWVVFMSCAMAGGDVQRPFAAEQKDGLTGLDVKLGSEPILVSSKTLVWDHKEHKATFQREVVARQQDLEIYCDDLMIFFNEDDSDVVRLVAKGNVKIIQTDRRAFCEEAIYDRSQNRIVLRGNPVLRQGLNEVTGNRIVFYVEENRSVVEGGDTGRVKVTLVPEQGKMGESVPGSVATDSDGTEGSGKK